MKRLGIVGGGQLGRMMVGPAKELGYRVEILDPTPNSPAGQVADAQVVAAYDDEEAIRALASRSDFLTFEIELAHAGLLDELAGSGVMVNPSAKTLGMIKDKLVQKEYLRSVGIPVADFVAVDGAEGAGAAGDLFGYPFLLKVRRDAYDGRGNALVKSRDSLPGALDRLAGRDLYAERLVPFAKELAMIAARDVRGEIALFPLVETIHRDNILHQVIAPAPVSPAVADRAAEVVRRVMDHLDGAGAFGIEMFLTEEGEVLVNELAPRVHNSGHYSIEACRTSQFAQHVRAVTGLSLGPTDMTVPAAAMVNILGDRTGRAQPSGIEDAESQPGVRVHMYGKAEVRPQRKMGHLTAAGASAEEALRAAEAARARIRV